MVSLTLDMPLPARRRDVAQSAGDVRPPRTEVPEAGGAAPTSLCVYDP